MHFSRILHNAKFNCRRLVHDIVVVVVVVVVVVGQGVQEHVETHGAGVESTAHTIRRLYECQGIPSEVLQHVQTAKMLPSGLD
jgi:hypothetical protein